MLSFDITLVNYRCFSIGAPARLEMRGGLTSFVGANNAGKSTLLRFFYEMRALFAQMAQPNVRDQWSRGNKVGSNAVGVGDQIEIFHNGNSLGVRLELRLATAEFNQLSGIDLFADRDNPSNWGARFRIGPNHVAYDAAAESNSVHNGSGGRVNVDYSLLDGLAGELNRTLYLPSTRIAIGEAQGNAYDLQFGSSFINLWDQWKTGPHRSQNAAINKVTEDIGRLFGFNRLEITATPDKRDLHVTINGQAFKLRELGSGLAQFVIVLANVAVQRPIWVLIDEPEISLHPSLQRDFLMTLASYASGGVLFATHSLGLARSADRVLSLRHDKDHTEVAPFEETSSFQEFLGEMSFAAYRDLGFDAVLAVEGVNDIKTVQQFLRLLGKDHRVVVLQLGGSQMIRPQRAHEFSEALRLTRNVHALIDSERSQPGEPLARSRADFLRVCSELRIRATATGRRAVEHYISDRAAKGVFGENYRALTEYEDRGAVNPVWGKSETWRAAREMTKAELLETDIGQFLEGI